MFQFNVLELVSSLWVHFTSLDLCLYGSDLDEIKGSKILEYTSQKVEGGATNSYQEIDLSSFYCNTPSHLTPAYLIRITSPLK